jgi:hypothetical protein
VALNNTPDELDRFINQVCSRTWEPAYAEYREHLAALNQIVRESGTRLEGGLFAEHLRDEIPDEPVPIFRNKRSNYAVFSSSGTSLLEIGFNAGHSCMLSLALNKDLVYTGVDIGMHAYTEPCFRYLKSVFGSRVTLHVGDSRDVVPALRNGVNRYDLFHLDGGHGFNIARADLCNIVNFSNRGSTLMVDDVNDHMIAGLCDYYVLQGRITRIAMRQLWCETQDHELFRINPSDII